MSTLALDLRGFGPTKTLPSERKTRVAGASILIHGLFVSAVVVVPLLSASNLPHTAGAMNSILIQPITVPPPPPPSTITQVRRPRDTTQAPISRALVVHLNTPTDIPTTTSPADLVDQTSASFSDASTGDDASYRSGDCLPGTPCGTLAVPIADTASRAIPHVGGLIKEPRLIFSRPPQYPALAHGASVSGRVVVEAHVGSDGLVKNCQVVEGGGLFDEAALSSIRSRRYQPLLLNGAPTDFLVTITMIFNINR